MIFAALVVMISPILCEVWREKPQCSTSLGVFTRESKNPSGSPSIPTTTLYQCFYFVLSPDCSKYLRTIYKQMHGSTLFYLQAILVLEKRFLTPTVTKMIQMKSMMIHRFRRCENKKVSRWQHW